MSFGNPGASALLVYVLPSGVRFGYDDTMSDAVILTAREYPPTAERPWVLRLTYGIVRGAPGVVAVEMYAVDPAEIPEAVADWPKLGHQVPSKAQPITSVGIRLPLGRYLREYMARRRNLDRIITDAHPRAQIPPGLRREAQRRLRALDASVNTRAPGRPALYGAAHCRKVAEVYSKGLPTGTLAVAKEFHASKSAAGKWVARARELGLLPPTVKGKAAGWQPTRTARRNHGQ